MRDEWSLSPAVPIPFLCFSALLQPLCSLLSPQDVPLTPHAEGHSVGSTRGTPRAAAIARAGRAARAQQAALRGGKPPTPLIEGLQQAFITRVACHREKNTSGHRLGKTWAGSTGAGDQDAQPRLGPAPAERCPPLCCSPPSRAVQPF